MRILLFALLTVIISCKYESETYENKKELNNSNKAVKKRKYDPRNKKNQSWVTIERPTYRLKFPASCKVDNSPENDAELIIFAPFQENKEVPAALSLTRITLGEGSIKEMIANNIENDRKNIEGFVLFKQTAEGYSYTKIIKDRKVRTHNKLIINDNTGFVFSYEAEEIEFNKFMNAAVAIFNSFELKP